MADPGPELRRRGTDAPPALTERVLRGALGDGPVAGSILGDLREEFAKRRRRGGSRAADGWYRRQALGVALRGVAGRFTRRGAFGTFSEDAHRNARMERMMTGTWSAVRHSARGLARTPLFTIPAMLTLAIAIGANASIFSVVRGVLLKPLAFLEAERLVWLSHTAPGLGYDDFGVSPGTFIIYSGHGQLFESAGIFRVDNANLTGDDAPPERVSVMRASRELISTLGLTPLLGRAFDEAEDRPGGPPVAMLTHSLWRDRFGGEPHVVGSSIRVDGAVHEIIGVLPERFSQVAREARLVLPLALDTTNASAGNFSFQAIARLAPGFDAALAKTRLGPAVHEVAEAYDEEADFAAFVEAGKLMPLVLPLKERVVGDAGRPLWILLGTVAFVFLIACANVTNLFLVRAEARQKEMAVRAALGGRRGGLVGRYLAEAGLIALAGGLAGLALALAGLRALVRFAPPGIPRMDEIAIDPLVLAFTLGVTALAAVLLGIIPTVRLARSDVMAALTRSGRGSTASRERNRVRRLLVVGQTALALVLLIGSGLMMRSYQRLRDTDPGFRTDDVLTFRVSLPLPSYPDLARWNAFHSQLLERLRALPGVDAVGAASHPPLAGCCTGTAHVVEDHPVGPGELPPMTYYSAVTDGYFEAMAIPLLAGRTFTRADRDSTARVVMVSEALARRFWPDIEPIGKRVRISGDTVDWRTVIGVVGDVRDRSLELDPSEMIYYPAASSVSGHAQSMTYAIGSSRASRLAPLARREVWAIDPNLPIASAETIERIVADSVARQSFTLLALIVAAAIALFLGTIGLYGVISYIVAQRTNELGIRLALGARPDQVRKMVVLEGARLAGFGLVIGFAAALGLTRLMDGLLFGIEPNDPATFASVTALLAAIATVASYIPARRASRIDPASSLKTE